MTTRYEFTAPVEDADLELFRRLLAAALENAGCTPLVERDPDPRYVFAAVRAGGRRIYSRQMIVR